MTALRRTRLLLVVLAAALLTTLTVTPADARAPHARAGRVTARIGLDTRLLTRSGASAWAIDEYLAAHTSLPPLGASFMAAERKYGINARFLLAAALHESGWGSGYIARVKHNLFGYNAYDRDPVRYATAYRTYAAGINDTARFMKDFYLTPGGRWWGGRPTLRSMQRFWSSSGRWGTNVSRIARSIRLDTLGQRRLRIATPVASGPVHPGQRVSVRVTWSGGRLPAKVGFRAAWVPVELDADVVAAAARLADPASAGTLTVTARRGRTGQTSTILTVPTPSQPGRYELRLEPRDAGGWPLPAVDRVAIPGVEVRVWAARAVSYAIEPSPDGSGAVVRITNTGRVVIPATSGTLAATSSNPEVRPPQSTITVAAAVGPEDPAPQVLRNVRLAADLAPGASIAVNVPGVAALTGRTTSWLSASVSVLDDATWLGATSTGGAWVHASASTAPVPTPAPTPAPTPPPAPTPDAEAHTEARTEGPHPAPGLPSSRRTASAAAPSGIAAGGPTHPAAATSAVTSPGRGRPARPRRSPSRVRRWPGSVPLAPRAALPSSASTGERSRESACGAHRSMRARCATAARSGPPVDTPSRSRCSRHQVTR